MCYAIFAALIVLLFVYSDALVVEYALTLRMNDSDWITVALGWEIAQVLWPLLLLAAVAGSAMTYLVVHLGRRRSSA